MERKILIAVPTYENIMPDTFKSIFELYSGGNQILFDYVQGYDCAAARNGIVQLGIAKNVDYILMVDSDMVLPRDALINLLEGDKDVALGYCPRRNASNLYDGKTAIYRFGTASYVDRFHVLEFRDMASRGEHKVAVHGGGMACALIKTSVFEKIEYPWFKWVNYDNGEVLSEDLYFCVQCKHHEIPIYVDTRVGCGHLFRHVQWPV